MPMAPPEAQSDQSGALYRLLLHCRNDISYVHVLQRIAGPHELQPSLRKRARFLFYDHADLALPNAWDEVLVRCCAQISSTQRSGRNSGIGFCEDHW
jgi:hypothetical protein